MVTYSLLFLLLVLVLIRLCWIGCGEWKGLDLHLVMHFGESVGPDKDG